MYRRLALNELIHQWFADCTNSQETIHIILFQYLTLLHPVGFKDFTPKTQIAREFAQA